MTSNLGFEDARARFLAWMRDDALPFWQQHAIDPEGGFFEALSLDGTPETDRVRRTRIMSRMAYTYAHAAHLGWTPSTNQATSDHAAASLLRLAATDGLPGFAHQIDAHRTIVDPMRDAYDHTFAVLAGTWRHRAFGQPSDLALARDAMDFLTNTLGEPDGSVRESVPPRLPRRQNPHMHLFEAALALSSETGQPADATRCHTLYNLFRVRFFDAAEGVIREFFQGDWRLDRDTGKTVEPGHMMEWCWLLHQYQAQFAVDTSALRATLFSRAEELGLNQDLGLLCDGVDMDAATPAPMTHRLWVQTEYVRGAIAQEAPATVARVLSAIHRYYINPAIPGAYRDQLNATGEPVCTALTPSTLYHLMGVVGALTSDPQPA